MDAQAQIQTTDETTYADVYAKVTQGNTITVAFGIKVPTWAPASTVQACDTIPGTAFPHGVYRCWNEGGVARFQRLMEPQPYVTCVNGRCFIR